MKLPDLGYDDHFESAFGEVSGNGMVPARVTAEHRGKYSLSTGDGDMPGEPAGRLRYCAESREDLPSVGDWVTATVLDGGDRAVIHHVLPRRTEIKRKEAGNRYDGQVIAANVDTVFIVQGLDGDFNIRRLERYLVLALESGADPVVLLSKSDLCTGAGLKEKSELAEKVSAGFPVHSFSSLAGDGLDGVRRHMEPGKTVCFIGSSGAGKSTLINDLAGKELLATASVRDWDSKGRHTTAARQMLFLPDGCIVIDTPGMREIGLLDASSAPDTVFPEIAERARECRYGDCTHTSEPGCAVLEALEAGEIDERRYQSYLKLRREAHHSASKHDLGLSLKKKRREKKFAKMVRDFDRHDVKRRFDKY